MNILSMFLNNDIIVSCDEYTECKQLLNKAETFGVHFPAGKKLMLLSAYNACNKGLKPAFHVVNNNIKFTSDFENTISFKDFKEAFNKKPYYFTVEAEVVYKSKNILELNYSLESFSSLEEAKKYFSNDIITRAKEKAPLNDADEIISINGNVSYGKNTFGIGDEYIDSDEFFEGDLLKN